MSAWELLVDGMDFGEGPRWHDGLLWYSDFHQASIYTVAGDGTRTTVLSGLADRPSGLGWMPDGSLLVVSMVERKLLRQAESGELVLHADLSQLASWHCNDMVVSAEGNAYVGNFGFDLEAAASYSPAELILVRPDGSAEVAAADMAFPNGSVITPDGRTLIVGESFSGGYVAFTIEADGSLTDRRRWADIAGTAPDGCTLDEAGGIWFSDALGSQVIRVEEGGQVTHTVPTPQPTFACMLGGDDGRTLHALCAPGSHPDEVAGKGLGGIHTMRVDHPRAGRP